MNEKNVSREISSKKFYVLWNVTPFGLVNGDQHM